MANLTKFFGLAGAVVVFAGLANAQPSTCSAVAPSTNIVRAEGTTELLPQLTINCAGTGVAGTLSIQIFLSPALPITSKVISNGQTEALAQIGGTSVNGTVSGSTLNFSGLASPGGNFSVVVSNVRVNVSSITVGSGVPPTISATSFISGSSGTITPIALSYSNIAFVQNGLGSASVNKTFTTANQGFPNGVVSNGGTNNFVICNGYQPKNVALGTVGTVVGSGGTNAGLAFVVQIKENFAAAFKTAADEASQVANSNAVVDGTRIAINFSNVPNNVTLYVPTGLINASNGISTGGNAPTVANPAQIQLTASGPGTAFAVVSNSGSSSVSGTGAGAGLAAVSISSGSGSAVFEVRADDLNNLDTYNVPVFIVTSGNAVAGSSTAITASVSFNPVGSSVIPNFAVTSSSNTVTGSTFNLCTTSLLFPFMTNQLGFDTGIAISNTSTDPFGGSGATAQAGICTLNFYGAGAPSPSAVPTPNVPSGTTYAAVLSSLAPGFQGYAIAQCAFQYAHGFAFITDGVGANGGLSQGYLAGVIPDTNQKSRGADPLSAAGAGSGETLGN
jgi:hypothetical protein